jgi:hypothetical protein
MNDIWNWCRHSADDSKCGQSPMSSQVLVHGHANNGHHTSCNVSDESDESQRLVAVNHVHVRRHEDTDVAEANQSRSC